jgi:hypothetical protein
VVRRSVVRRSVVRRSVVRRSVVRRSVVRRSVVRRSVVFMAERCPPGGRLAAGKAMYLGVTVYRIHGTNQPSTAGGPSEEEQPRAPAVPADVGARERDGAAGGGGRRLPA